MTCRHLVRSCALSLTLLSAALTGACGGSEGDENGDSGDGDESQSGDGDEQSGGDGDNQTGDGDQSTGDGDASGGTPGDGDGTGGTSSGGMTSTGGNLGTGGGEVCPPCAPPPNDNCVGQGICGCGPYVCPGEECGEVTCPETQVCCNPLASLCTDPGESCIQ